MTPLRTGITEKLQSGVGRRLWVGLRPPARYQIYNDSIQAKIIFKLIATPTVYHRPPATVLNLNLSLDQGPADFLKQH